MFFVHVRWHGRNDGVRNGVRYISHREEGLPKGKTRTLYGIGERYQALRGDERALTNQLWRDGDGLRNPRYFRIKLTVDDATAKEFSRLSAEGRERAMRDAVTRTFRGAFRHAQGVFVIHEHGGKKRPWGHPHAHVHLSPLLANGRPLLRISPVHLRLFKERWEREAVRELERALDRETRRPRGPIRALMVENRRRRRRPDPSLLRAVRRGLEMLHRWRARGPLRELSPSADAAARLRKVVASAPGHGGRTLGREALRQLVRSLPDGAWAGLEAVRWVGRVIPR